MVNAAGEAGKAGGAAGEAAGGAAGGAAGKSAGRRMARRTLIHGDPKGDNLLLSKPIIGGSGNVPSGAPMTAAAYDWQYCGGGLGVRDVAYFLASSVDAKVLGRGLNLSTSELNLRLFGTHRSLRAQLEHLRVSSTGQFGLFLGQCKLKLSGTGQSQLKSSGNWNECKTLVLGSREADLVAAYHTALMAGLAARGRAVQLDPIKPTLKAPGSKRLKPEDDKLLSDFAFNFN